MDVVWTILIGLAAGWIASLLMKVRGYGLVGYLVVGVVGAFVGGFIFTTLGFQMVSLVSRLVAATVGALLLLGLLRYLRRKLR